jgi:protein-L-isoaspartate(D-aspartate) O-methyltransferase
MNVLNQNLRQESHGFAGTIDKATAFKSKECRPACSIGIPFGTLLVTCSFVFSLILSSLSVHSFAATTEKDFERQRKRMVSVQLKGRGISDSRVLKVMEIVPRHLFVPLSVRSLAYQDSALPIGFEQTISQPYIVALMSQLLSLTPGEKVLEVGTGSGYQAAVLSQMGADVFSIEIIPELGLKAEGVLKELGYNKIKVKTGDGYLGWPEESPFDAIIVTCAPTSIPEPLKNQLKEGGEMIIPVGEKEAQKLYLLTKKEGKILQKKIIDVRFVPMVDEKGKSH